MSLPDPVDPVATLWAGIGERVWSLRRDQGMTQQELALKLGLSRALIANLEKLLVRYRRLVERLDALGDVPLT